MERGGVLFSLSLFLTYFKKLLPTFTDFCRQDFHNSFFFILNSYSSVKKCNITCFIFKLCFQFWYVKYNCRSFKNISQKITRILNKAYSKMKFYFKKIQNQETFKRSPKRSSKGTKKTYKGRLAVQPWSMNYWCPIAKDKSTWTFFFANPSVTYNFYYDKN